MSEQETGLPPYQGGPLRNPGTPRYLFTYDGEVDLTPHGAELARQMLADAAAIANQKPYQPSNAFPTEQSLREFVKKCVHEALDELADALHDKALQPGTWRKGVE